MTKLTVTLERKGPQGDKGDTGVGVQSTIDNGDGTFTVNYTDGTSFVTSDLTGPTGADSTVAGPQGVQGPQGDQGVAGPQGPAGQVGATGSQGVQGLKGDKGDKGDTGADSTVQGPQGDIGPQGPQGPQGADSTVVGPTGPQGPQGATGPQGPQGADSTVAGPTGPQGEIGPQGPQGPQGQAGPLGIGIQGPQGATGPQGPSGDVGNSGIGDLNDVDTNTAAPADGQALVWNNTNSDWEPGDVGIDGISSSSVDTDDPRSWLARSEQIIGVGSYNTSGVEIAAGEGHPRDLFFKPDGTRLFFVGNGLDDIQSVDLPTAWDLSSIESTATVTSVNLAGSSSIGGRGFEGALYGMHVADDPTDTSTYGKKFFIVGDQQDEVQEYTCTTAWDLSTMSVDATAVLDLRTDHGNSVYSITFKPDGSVMYIGRAGNPNTFSHFDLSTAWDLSTAVYNSSKSATISVTEASYGSNEGYVINVSFKIRRN